jgi:hypothetical protein
MLFDIGRGLNQLMKKKLRDFSPQANYTDRATGVYRRSLVPTFAERECRVVSATNPQGR